MEKTLEALANDEIGAALARDAVWHALGRPTGYRDAYAALCRWTWRIMLERRLDEELRSWHRLLLDTAARMARQTPVDQAASPSRSRLEPAAAAERLRALADILRLSVEAAAASMPTQLGKRAHVLEILRHLAENAGEYVERERIRTEVGLGDANLSRILTLMTANGLAERLPRGKVASFRATQRGLAVASAPDSTERERARAEMPPPPRLPQPFAPGHKVASFEPLTKIRSGNHVRNVRADRSGQMDHEQTYTPLIVTRGLDSGASRGSAARTGTKEFAL